MSIDVTQNDSAVEVQKLPGTHSRFEVISMRNKQPPMNLSPEEQSFLRHWHEGKLRLGRPTPLPWIGRDLAAMHGGNSQWEAVESINNLSMP
jgi:hypothetical protein